MTRRLFWLATGFGLGIAASRRVQRTAEQLIPATLADRVRHDVEAAVAVGRREMRTREVEMRAVLAKPLSRPSEAGR